MGKLPIEFKSVQIFSEEECQAISQRVKDLPEYWVNRRNFYTLGASTYLDDPRAYPAIATAFNQVIASNFQGSLTRVAKAISEIKELPVVFKLGTGLPSFHIFDKSANGLDGSIHIDEPYDRVSWKQDIRDPFSFTILMESPSGGAGLDLWPACTDDDIEAYEKLGVTPEPLYFPYEKGEMYIHSGLVPHRIANPCSIEDGEHRITFQGHGVTLADHDKIVIYF